MMENQTPMSIASAKSTARGHSPYCEATGPIVHEGFVAARVRAIQANFDGTPQNLSHSPLIPCPVPHWRQIADSQTPPHPPSSGRHKGSPKYAIDTGSAVVPSRSEPQSDIRTVGVGMAENATSQTFMGPIINDNIPISSPTPILPVTTPVCDKWLRANYGDGQQSYYFDSENYSRPLSSVADRSTSLVDRGGVGCDVLGKVSSDNCNPEIHASLEKSHNGIPSERNSNWQKPHKKKLQVRRLLYPTQESSVHHQHQMAQVKDACDDDHLEPAEKKRRYRHGFRMRSESQSNVNTRIGSSECNKTQLSETENDRPLNQLQTKIRRRGYFVDCQSQISECGKLSLSQEIEHHLSHWEKACTVNHEHLGVAGFDPTNLQCNDESQTPPGMLDREDHHAARTDMQQPDERLSGSTSWFSKLAGLRLALLDRAPIMQVLSRRISEPAIGSVALQDQHQHQQRHDNPRQHDDQHRYRDHYEHEMRRQHTPAEHLFELSGTENPFAESDARHSHPRSDTPKMPRTARKEKDHPMGVPVTGDSVRTPDSTIHQYVPLGSSSHSHSSPITVSLHPTALDAQEHAPGQINRKEPSEVPSARGSRKEGSIRASHSASSSRIAHKLYESGSKSLNSERIAKSSIADVSESQAPENVPTKLKSAVIARSIAGQAKVTRKSSQWEVAGNGRGIKRVQVIVSLDGADDLIIDANLLTTPEERVEPRVEEAGDQVSEQLSDCSSQDFF